MSDQLPAIRSDDPPERQATRTRGPDGGFVATIETAQRDAEAARLRSRGMSYRAIATRLDISVSTAYEAVHRALDAIRAEAGPDVKALELERLDSMWEVSLGILEATTTDPDTEAEVPAAPEVRLKALGTLLKIAERRAKLLGLDAEQKVSVSGGVTYEIIGVAVDQL
jgi:hypothetical protein